jgi:hypothetical protein
MQSFNHILSRLILFVSSSSIHEHMGYIAWHGACVMAALITFFFCMAPRCVTFPTAPMLMGVLRNIRVDSLRAHLQAHVAEACTRGWSLHEWLEFAGLASGTSDLIPPYMRMHYPILLFKFGASGTAGFSLYKRVIQSSFGPNRNCRYDLIPCLPLR